MADGIRFELIPEVSKTSVLPLHQPSIFLLLLVDEGRIGLPTAISNGFTDRPY